MSGAQRDTRERKALVAHVSRCAFCRALLVYSRRRRDRALLDAADLLAWEHAENDADHEAFARSAATRARRGIGPSKTQTETLDGLLISAVTSKTRLPDGLRDA